MSNTKTYTKRKTSNKPGLGFVETYNEALRYIENGNDCLKKAKKHGDYYDDPKYIKMAGNTYWNGVLIALEAKYKGRLPKGRPSIEKYQEIVGKENRTMLKALNSAYNYCHLLMGYDGDLTASTAKTAKDEAMKIIIWATR